MIFLVKEFRAGVSSRRADDDLVGYSYVEAQSHQEAMQKAGKPSNPHHYYLCAALRELQPRAVRGRASATCSCARPSG